MKNISRNIEAVFFKPSTRNVHHKRNKMATVVLLPNNSFATHTVLNF